jgi:hypothetical protein
MSSSVLKNRLKIYSAISASSLACSSIYSQIIHFSVQKFISGSDVYSIDLDNNGVIDFVFDKESRYINNLFRHKMYGIGLNGSFVVGSKFTVASIYEYPDISYVNLLAKLSSTYVICPDNYFKKNGLLFNIWEQQCSKPFSCFFNYSGYWGGSSFAFLGIKFNIEGNSHYGWMRLNADRNGRGIYIKDYAYETTPDKCVEGPPLKLLPNPASSILNVFSKQTISRVEIIDLSGKLINEYKHNLIDVSDLPNGIYFVRVQYSNREFSNYEKLIINK